MTGPLDSEAGKAALTAWARTEARCLLLDRWLDTMTADEAMTRQPHQQASPAKVWLDAEKHAMRLRERLGMLIPGRTLTAYEETLIAWLAAGGHGPVPRPPG